MICTRIVEWDKPNQRIVCRKQIANEEDQLIEPGFEYVRLDEKQMPYIPQKEIANHEIINL